ncbi:hypothetical protein CPT34_28185 [Rhizobium sophoriradicis]|uniref:Uncharacterized protein n=1 Tax=Rhizobium sophoriradicis TaxID=1535245 RepID=A0A2A5KL59_9HYPH|nr:hypothetical protein CPT34_28185 [Rhizobium sophoriradicis]
MPPQQLFPSGGLLTFTLHGPRSPLAHLFCSGRSDYFSAARTCRAPLRQVARGPLAPDTFGLVSHGSLVHLVAFRPLGRLELSKCLKYAHPDLPYSLTLIMRRQE